MSSQEHYDVIVVGMGICGSALTHALGRKGKRVLSFERDMSMPDKIIGELLQVRPPLLGRLSLLFERNEEKVFFVASSSHRRLAAGRCGQPEKTGLGRLPGGH